MKADAKGPEWGKGHRGFHRFIKRRKIRIERRRAKAEPECQPAYGRYSGWEL